MKNTPQLKLIIATFLVAFSPLNLTTAKAQNTEQLIDQQDWITRQQQNQIEEQNRIKEENAIEKDREKRKKEEEKSQENLQVSDKLSKCFPILEIEFSEANSLSKREKRKLAAPFLGKCIDAQILTEIISSVNSFYHKKGYTLAAAAVLKQNIESGILKLQIYEGKIDEIILNDDSFFDKMQKFTAFGFIEGGVLKIQDINQGLYQINRLPSNNATMKIEPSSIEGEALVAISNQKKFPARATIGYDNLGNEFTGVKRTSFSGGIDNLLSLNDAINLSYSTNLNDDSQKKEIKAFSSGISIPFTYSTLSYDFSHSEFRGQNAGINGPIKITGFSQRNSVTLDRVLFSEGNLRISASTSIATKSSASYLNDTKIENSQRKLTVGDFGLTISNYFKNGTNLYLKPSYSRGLKLLNAKQDNKNIPASSAKAQFEVFKIYSSVSKKITLPKVEIPLLLASEMNGQFSKQTLFGTEQISVGGYYSVRGFRENYIVGDSGYYFRNKANLNVGSLVATFSSDNQNGFFSKNLVHFNKFSIEPFYDYGYVRNKYDGSSGRLAGAGAKTIFDGKYFDASLTYSWGLNKSQLINSTIKENKLIYFEISASCC